MPNIETHQLPKLAQNRRSPQATCAQTPKEKSPQHSIAKPRRHQEPRRNEPTKIRPVIQPPQCLPTIDGPPHSYPIENFPDDLTCTIIDPPCIPPKPSRIQIMPQYTVAHPAAIANLDALKCLNLAHIRPSHCQTLTTIRAGQPPTTRPQEGTTWRPELSPRNHQRIGWTQ